MTTFRHTAIIGLGLLGGSLALDLREKFPQMEITGIARRRETLNEAAMLRVGESPVFDQLTAELAAVNDADLIVVCTPVQTILAQLAAIAPHLRPGALVTDVGSTKRTVMNAASAVLPPTVHFVGGHPMAGSDRSGLSHSRANLYRNATWAFCIPAGAEEAADRLAELVSSIGAVPLNIDADLHDALVAMTSHLPHVLACALANVALGSEQGEAVLPFIAGGFRDSTRVAAASPVMWRDICLTNRDKILAALSLMSEELDRWKEAIGAGDEPHLEALLTTAHNRREELNHLLAEAARQ